MMFSTPLEPHQIEFLRRQHFMALCDREPSRTIRMGWQVRTDAGPRFLTEDEIQQITETA